MQQKFLRNLAFLLVLNLLIKPFYILGIDRSVQNTVGADEYGFYFALFSFSYLFHILLDFGLTSFNNRNIAQNSLLLGKHLPKLLVLKLLLFAVYLLVVFVGSLIIDYTEEQIILLAFLAINQFLLSLILYLRSNLSGLHLFKTDSFISVLDRLLMIVIVGLLLWGNLVDEFKIKYFVYAQAFSYAITLLVCFILVLRKSELNHFRLKFDWPFLVLIFRKSFPFALLVLLMTFYTRIDSVMLERLLPDGKLQSGIYASAFRLLDAVNHFSYLFAVLLLPIFSRMLKEKKDVKKLVKLSFTLIMMPAVVFSVGSMFFSSDAMRALYPIHQGESLVDFAFRQELSAKVLILLMSCFVCTSANYIFGTLLTANGNLRELNIIALSAVAISVLLNLILIPKYQVVGSAVASLATHVVVMISQILVVLFKMKLPVGFIFPVRFAMFVLGSFLAAILASSIEIGLGQALLLFAITTLVVAILVGFFPVRDFVSILIEKDRERS